MIKKVSLLISLVVLCFATASLAGQRPYSNVSPWNLRVGPNPVYDKHSDVFVRSMSGLFGSKVTKYTMPVYEVDTETPFVPVYFSGSYTEVDRENRRATVSKEAKIPIPVPAHAVPAAGRDGQIIVWNPKTGDEWGLWRVESAADAFLAVNGYHYNTNWSGVPPYGFFNRGAGVPYLAGLVRPWEIAQGRIDHAIAFGANYPNEMFVYPATKSDGRDLSGEVSSEVSGKGQQRHIVQYPSGARLQLDPSLTDEDFEKWELTPAARVIARALQEYGMILVDSSGHPKIYAEYEGTAEWNGVIRDGLLYKIPYTAFRVLDLGAPERPDVPKGVTVTNSTEGVLLSWQPVSSATRYRVYRRLPGKAWDVANAWVTKTEWQDEAYVTGAVYTVVAVSHNGVSEGSAAVRLE